MKEFFDAFISVSEGKGWVNQRYPGTPQRGQKK
jgi:hypothetical protein